MRLICLSASFVGVGDFIALGDLLSYLQLFCLETCVPGFAMNA
jgi:hypothetical protein